MRGVFICKKCGSTVTDLPAGGSAELYCNSCGGKLSWDNHFPNLEINDFAQAAELLFNQAKKNDEENTSKMEQFLREMDVILDKSAIISYRDKYENICSKYSDNDDSNWLKISDEFEDYICNREGTDRGISILAAISATKRNRLRKPCIIMIASVMEHALYDYCNDVIIKYGKEVEYKKIENPGIDRTIDFLKKECDISLKKEMDKHSRTFYDCWSQLKKVRNDIIHRNNKYVSRNYLKKAYKLVEESMKIFTALKKDLFSEAP